MAAERPNDALRKLVVHGIPRAPQSRLNAVDRTVQSRFIDDWCRANKQKPSGIESKESVFRRYLVPVFGNRRLDTLTPADEERLKKAMIKLSKSTYNNTASVMNSALKAAVRWRVIPYIRTGLPC